MRGFLGAAYRSQSRRASGRRYVLPMGMPGAWEFNGVQAIECENGRWVD